MKPFEEQYTAWVDDRLPGPELASFEQSLPAIEAAQADKLALQQMQRLLQEHRLRWRLQTRISSIISFSSGLLQSSPQRQGRSAGAASCLFRALRGREHSVCL
jgi:hypothetical protein